MRVTEGQVADTVCQILAAIPSGEASIANLVREIPKYLKLSPEDRTVSKTRKNEELWEQQVRNIISHAATEGNFIYEGYLVPIKGGLKITDAGRLRVQHKGG
jgi:hypothetical protein